MAHQLIFESEHKMNPSHLTSSNPRDKAAVLTSWKEIANYMGKGVRTVQRWEQDFGLPVRRPRGSSKKAILARPCDLDAWVALRCSSRAVTTGAPGLPAPPLAAGLPAPPLAAGLPAPPLAVLISLNMGIETSRQLRTNNQVLLDEFKSALTELQQQIAAMRVGR
jgi:hypothetical protein